MFISFILFTWAHNTVYRGLQNFYCLQQINAVCENAKQIIQRAFAFDTHAKTSGYANCGIPYEAFQHCN